jgi:hypothetical protein
MRNGLNPFRLPAMTARVGRGVPTEFFILNDVRTEGATIGQLAGNPIVETVVDTSGHRYRYVGVATPDVFVLGYGLHLADLYRNLPRVVQADRHIVQHDPAAYVPTLYGG